MASLRKTNKLPPFSFRKKRLFFVLASTVLPRLRQKALRPGL
jgi:hypothetical protein